MAEAFIEVDHGPDGAPARFARPSRIDRGAEGPDAVPAALAALDRALAGGAWVAGYAGYELGYAFEPRLAPLLPAGRRLPLLDFGVFPAPGPAAPAAPGGELGPFRPRWDVASLSARPSRGSPSYIRAGDIYQANLTLPLERALERRPGGARRRGWRRGSRWGTGRWWRCRGDAAVALAGAVLRARRRGRDRGAADEGDRAAGRRPGARRRRWRRRWRRTRRTGPRT